MDRIFLTVTKFQVDQAERVLTGIATTPVMDRVGDIVESDGGEWKLPLPLLDSHDHRRAVGEVEYARRTAEGIEFRARIAKINHPGPAKDLVDECWALVAAGLRKAVSIGFRAIETAPLPTGTLFRRWEWLELSLCAVGANQDARITGVKSSRRSSNVKLNELSGGLVSLNAKEKAFLEMNIAAQERLQQRRASRRRLGIPDQERRVVLDPISVIRGNQAARKAGRVVRLDASPRGRDK